MKNIEVFKNQLLTNGFIPEEYESSPFITYYKDNLSVSIDDTYITTELPNINITRYPDDIILPYGEKNGTICINHIKEPHLMSFMLSFINDPYTWIYNYTLNFSTILGKCTHNNYGYNISDVNIPNYITLSNQLDTYINIFIDFLSLKTTIQPRISNPFCDVPIYRFNELLEKAMRNEWDEHPVYVNNTYKGTLLELTLNMDQTCYHMSKDEFFKFCESL